MLPQELALRIRSFAVDVGVDERYFDMLAVE
jgi:hypothetical protein